MILIGTPKPQEIASFGWNYRIAHYQSRTIRRDAERANLVTQAPGLGQLVGTRSGQAPFDALLPNSRMKSMTGVTSTHYCANSTSGLADRLDEALTANPHLFGRKFGYEADDGTVVLTGTVNSYFQKQMAQEAIRRVDGVEQIDNRLQVDWS